MTRVPNLRYKIKEVANTQYFSYMKPLVALYEKSLVASRLVLLCGVTSPCSGLSSTFGEWALPSGVLQILMTVKQSHVRVVYRANEKRLLQTENKPWLTQCQLLSAVLQLPWKPRGHRLYLGCFQVCGCVPNVEDDRVIRVACRITQFQLDCGLTDNPNMLAVHAKWTTWRHCQKKKSQYSETRLLRILKGNEKRYVLNKVRFIQNKESAKRADWRCPWLTERTY